MNWQIKLEENIRSYLQGYKASHDYWHLDRVRNHALEIAKVIESDKEILEAAALLHDVGYRYHEDDKANHHIYSMELADKWLPQVGFPVAKLPDVREAIRLHDNYHLGSKAEKTDHVEALIIQDADKIDAIGAIGVTRLTYYFGEQGYPIYKPGQAPESDEIWSNYSLIDQFKRDTLKKWDLLHFDCSRELSRGRFNFLELFCDKLEEELLEHHGDQDGPEGK